MTVEIISRNLDETTSLGQVLAKVLIAGDIVLLKGPLGAGKTALVKGIVTGLDAAVAPLVSSPTYVVVGEYPTRPLVVHLDLYRLSSVDEVIGLGYEELLYGEDRIALIEWPELLEPLLEPDDSVLRLELFHREDPNQRRIVASSKIGRLENALSRISH